MDCANGPVVRKGVERATRGEDGKPPNPYALVGIMMACNDR